MEAKLEETLKKLKESTEQIEVSADPGEGRGVCPGNGEGNMCALVMMREGCVPW